MQIFSLIKISWRKESSSIIALSGLENKWWLTSLVTIYNRLSDHFLAFTFLFLLRFLNYIYESFFILFYSGHSILEQSIKLYWRINSFQSFMIFIRIIWSNSYFEIFDPLVFHGTSLNDGISFLLRIVHKVDFDLWKYFNSGINELMN